MSPDPSGLLQIIQEFATLKGISTGTEHLLEVFKRREEQESASQDAVRKAEEIDWSRVRYWREVFKIPGDELWEGDDSLVDGIQLKDVTGHDDPPQEA